jgi:phosphopantetheinyl transferase (holo-ACP synthase)
MGCRNVIGSGYGSNISENHNQKGNVLLLFFIILMQGARVPMHPSNIKAYDQDKDLVGTPIIYSIVPSKWTFASDRSIQTSINQYLQNRTALIMLTSRWSKKEAKSCGFSWTLRCMYRWRRVKVLHDQSEGRHAVRIQGRPWRRVIHAVHVGGQGEDTAISFTGSTVNYSLYILYFIFLQTSLRIKHKRKINK